MYTIKFTTTVHVTLPVQLAPTRHKHERRAARARKCGHACASMQARACTTLSQRTHRSRPKSWATAHGDARAVEHEVVALRRPARREPAREAREGRGGVRKVVAEWGEEARPWARGSLACAGPASGGRKRTWAAVGVDGRASRRAALGAREQVQQTCHEERSQQRGRGSSGGGAAACDRASVR